MDDNGQLPKIMSDERWDRFFTLVGLIMNTACGSEDERIAKVFQQADECGKREEFDNFVDALHEWLEMDCS